MFFFYFNSHIGFLSVPLLIIKWLFLSSVSNLEILYSFCLYCKILENFSNNKSRNACLFVIFLFIFIYSIINFCLIKQ